MHAADLAAQRVSLKYVHFFENVPDEYFRQRVADIRDVTTRLVDNLTGWSQHDRHTQLTEPSILVSSDLTPSQTVQINRQMIAGIVTGRAELPLTSGSWHAPENPAVAGMHRATEIFKTGQQLLVDGYRGIVILSPTEEEIHSYDVQVEQERELAHSLEEDAAKPVATLDGRNIILAANLGQPRRLCMPWRPELTGSAFCEPNFSFSTAIPFPVRMNSTKII
jgi:phosphotransferase system enzyme I (PtsI)